MTRAQHAHYFELWANACAYQGWDRLSTKDREAKRKEIMADVFGGPKSAKDVNKDKEFGAIKARFLMLAGNVQGGVEDGKAKFDNKRRLLWVIEQKKKLIALYQDHPDEYLHTVLRERFKRFNGLNSIDDLSAERTNEKPSQLEQLIFTLSARINDMRNDAGHTIHEMNTLARVPCAKTCKACEFIHREQVSGETFADATDEVAMEPDQTPDDPGEHISEEVLVEAEENVPF